MIAISFKISTAVGTIIGLAMCYAGWRHNPQCEFHCDGFVDWYSFFILWASWLVTVSVVGGAIMSLLLYVFNFTRSDKNV